MATYAVVPPAVCKTVVVAVATVTLACSHCGHSNFLHPGSSNPALTSCFACLLLAGPKALAEHEVAAKSANPEGA